MRFQGFDHIDTRVTSIKLAEAFYDRLLPELGFSAKRHSHVDGQGDWHEADDKRPYNAVEYYESKDGVRPPYFIGFIEDPAMTPSKTRIAFREESRDRLNRWHDLLTSIGARNIEWSAEMDAYPAIFFEDPCGTKLEICARKP